MLKLVARLFEKFVNILLWLILIITSVMGGIGGSIIYKIFIHNDNTPIKMLIIFLGVLIGFVFGFFINIIYGGLIANYLILCKNVKLLVNIVTKSKIGLSAEEEILNLSENNPRLTIDKIVENTSLDAKEAKKAMDILSSKGVNSVENVGNETIYIFGSGLLAKNDVIFYISFAIIVIIFCLVFNFL